MNKTYPNKCRFCNSPSRNISGRIICSNVKCKTWKSIRTQMAKIKLPAFSNIGDTKDDPIIIYCKECASICNPAHHTDNVYCYKCGYQEYTYEKNKYYLWQYGDKSRSIAIFLGHIWEVVK